MNKKSRELSFDILKSLAIYLVLWGHCMQHLQHEVAGRDFFVFRLIYSFHMPLFMMVSGYFAYSSFNLSPKVFFLKKVKRLLWPWISGSIIICLLTLLGLSDVSNDLPLLLILKKIMWHFWFFRSLFICYAIVFCSKRISSNYWIVISLVLMRITSLWQIPLLGEAFIVGLLMKEWINKWTKKKEIRVLLVLSFVVCFYTIYDDMSQDLIMFNFIDCFFTKGSYTMSNCAVELVWTIMALSICVFLLINFKCLNINNRGKLVKFFEKAGQNTLQIYFLQTFVLEIFMPQLFIVEDSGFLFSCLLCPFISFIVLLICCNMSELIKKSNYLNYFLFSSYKHSC